MRPSLLHVHAVLAFTIAACNSTPRTPSARAADTATFVATTDAWHADRIERLTAPDGWLALVTLAWLQPGPNRVGRASDAAVTYAGLPAEHVGTLYVAGESVRFEQVSGVSVNGVPEDGLLRTDADGAPTILELGPIRFYVIERGGRLAVRMKDANAATRTEFTGIERYPTGEAWRIVADFVPVEEGTTVDADSVIGFVNEIAVAGRARFVHEGHAVDMVLPEASGKGHYVMFGDATNGDGTYSGGRYLLVEPTADGASVVLDFNRAYNPPCSFTPYATCLLPVPSNRLPFDVTAGERYESGE